MVTAHNDDLVHTASHGMRTAYMAQPTEYGPYQDRDFEAEHVFDFAVSDFIDSVAKLGCGR